MSIATSVGKGYRSIFRINMRVIRTGNIGFVWNAMTNTIGGTA